MKRLLTLKGRYYRTVPLTSPGYAEEDLELDLDRTALISLHCWNVGCPENPLDENFWVYMGFPEVTEEAHRIIREVIGPAIDMARRVGMLVCHVQSASIARKYPQNLVEDVPNLSAGYRPSKPAIPGHRRKILERSHGAGYMERSPLRKSDFPREVAPLPGEPVVYTSEQLDYVARRRGVVNLIYTGFAADMCLLFAPGGIRDMAELGYRILLIREATLGVEMPDWFRERVATRWAIRFVETHYGDTISFKDFINGLSLFKR